MRKIFKILILPLLVFSCDSLDKDLIGVWVWERGERSTTYTFNKDKTGTISRSNKASIPCKWTTNGNTLKMLTNIGRVNKSRIVPQSHFIYKYDISSDGEKVKLVLHNISLGKTSSEMIFVKN